MQEFFDVAVGDEVPLAWCQKHVEGPVFEPEDGDGENHYHDNHPNQRPAKRFKMLPEAHRIGVGIYLLFLHSEKYFEKQS